MQFLPPLLAVLSGSVVGFALGLIGGGGSILATPLLLYVVGLHPHVAIGTGAVAVSANAFASFWSHARAGNVRWRSATQFSIVGVVGAAIGATLAREVDGKHLLFLFANLMIVVGVLMLRRKRGEWRARMSAEPAPATRRDLLRLAAVALTVGTRCQVSSESAAVSSSCPA